MSSSVTNSLVGDREDPGVHGKKYPQPLATHEAVVSHSSLFWDTLEKFHSAMGTRFMIPVIGGKELDLHVLYVEVTRRGGYEKVVLEKKWREISSIFNFSPTTTSASYVLKKHYQSLLLPYEQAYLFKLEAPPLFSSTATASPADKPSNGHHQNGYVEHLADNLDDGSLSGTIDGKFDCGYLVSVKMGSETLRGVLYFADQPAPNHQKPPSVACNSIIPYMGGVAAHPNPCNSVVPYTGTGSGKLGRPGRKRRRTADPARPKPNRSGYNFYFADEHQKLKSQFPDKEREFTKMIGASWNNLSPEEKAVYQEIGLRDKQRYEKEKQDYKESLKHLQGTSGSAGQ